MNRKPRFWERLGTSLDPHLNNLKYLARHKWAVLRAGLKLNVPILRLIIHDWSKLTPIEWFAYTAYFFNKRPNDNMHVPGRKPVGTVQNPDGKLVDVVEDSDNELKEYLESEDAKYCPPPPGAPNTADVINEADRVAQQFDKAWLHHIHMNPHHWQHFVLSQDDGEVKCLEMPAHFAREMVSDWIGAGVAQGKTDKTSVLVWYEKNKQFIKLHDRTRELVESLIKVYVHS